MKKELYYWEELTLNEAFNRTVVNIHLRRQENNLKTFVLCGCSPKVGTTAISINLAIAMASSGWKTVLIDADLRKGQMNKRLAIKEQFEEERNLAGFLAGSANIHNIIAETNYDNLSYISGGDPVKDPIQLLCSTHMAELFEYLKSEFDYIIIDAPAPSAVVDTCILASQADDVVIVARWDHTTTEQINDTRTELEASGASIMGIIVNRMDERFYEHYFNSRWRPKKEKKSFIWKHKGRSEKRSEGKNEKTID